MSDISLLHEPGPQSADIFAPMTTVASPIHQSAWRRLARGLLANPASIAGTVLLIGYLVVAILAPVLAPCPQSQLRLCGRDPYMVPRYGFSLAKPEPPSAEHPFGLTPQRYDIFYGVVWGARNAFLVGVIIIAVALFFGVVVGATAGYFGGPVDELLMRIVEVFMAFPFFVAALALASILRAKPGIPPLVPAIVALIVFGWMTYARLIRSDILSLREREYILAARSLGASHARIIARHIVPNAIFPVLVLASLDIGTIVLSFAALSFVGVGVPDGYADWGQMLSSARSFIPQLNQYWYIIIFPGLAILLFSLAWNLIGDAVRDVMDPRLSGRAG